MGPRKVLTWTIFGLSDTQVRPIYFTAIVSKKGSSDRFNFYVNEDLRSGRRELSKL